MKGIIFILAIVVFASCEKKHTYVCTNIFYNGYTPASITTTTHTGWSEDDANRYETRSYRVFNNGKGYQRSHCHIKN